MCGIFGYLLRRGERQPDLDVACRALHHRGPDDRGTYAAPAGDDAVGMAFTRLKILDLSQAGHQPMRSHDGRYVMVFNGEIYNFAEIRADLQARGDTFVSTGDSEVLLAAYARWGRDSLQRLRGMFAFAIWDERDRVLFLARDRLGVKPLYYVDGPRGIVFASEVRALLAVGATERRIDAQGLSTYLARGAVRDPSTILANVRALPPGCTLTHRAGSSHVERYWMLPLEESPLRREAQVEKLREHLTQAVRMRLVADVPVGVFLSSGMDSGAIVALASRLADEPIRTFTVTFDAAADEGAVARERAKQFGCIHGEAHLATSAIAGQMESALSALDQPSADGVNTFFVSKAARENGLAVALSGIGGDEIFAGYPVFRRFRSMLAAGRVPLPRGARAVVSRLVGSAHTPNDVRKGLALVEAGPGLEASYGVARAMFVASQQAVLVDPDVVAHPNHYRTLDGAIEDAFRRGALDATNAFGAMELANYLTDQLLRDTDAMSMAHSLEVREPLLDHQLVECAMRIPGPEKLRGGGNKPLLGAVVQELAGPAQRAAKRGFDLPFAQWLRGPLREWTRERLLGAQRPGWFRRGAVEDLWNEFDSGGRGITWSRVWCLAVVADWCERHRVEA